MKNEKLAMSREIGRIYCALLLVCVTAGLWADASEDSAVLPATIQGGSRPLRGVYSKPPPTLNSPLSTLNSQPYRRYASTVPQVRLNSPLLTPEAISRPLTQQYIRRYTNPNGILWLNSVIKNSEIYLPYIREEIEKHGLPPELIYLPFIESGYLATARSRSGAAGLWQFMMNSIPAGMKVNDMIDERRDFRKSTTAALQKLAENYRILGDWHLALAAYNAGLGGVSRAVRNGNTSDYWLLCEKKELKNETIHYVPRFLAVVYILSRPRQFGLDYWPQAEEWTVIKPERQASLDLIASETGADHKLLRQLNAELLYGITPADSAYELKVPIRQADMIAAILEKEDVKLLRYYYHKVQYGDTLSALSRHYGISLNLIEQHNHGIMGRYLKIGEIVIIPAFRETGPYTAPPAPAVEPPAGAFEGIHIVSKGDTLWSIAVYYKVDPLALARANNMGLNEILSIGKVLKVPIME
ncbi:MAG: transglycosylase SLT domain-containing protein [Treponema sp.]|jgi:membrane-bound lytic murein transglycosylase D|nr:transglycosylase SLT domain-containing protein [Treponema sp.]